MVMYLPHNLIMFKVNIADAKTHFSRYLDMVAKGETIVVCRRNVPVAEIRPVPRALREDRPVGIDRGMTIPSEFFDPLPDEVLDAFEGGGGSE